MKISKKILKTVHFDAKSGQKSFMTNQEIFMNNHRKFHRNITLWQIFLFGSFLVLWELAAFLGWIDSFFFCSPSIVVISFYRMLVGEGLLMHIGYSLLEIIASFFIIFVASFLIAVLLWYYLSLARIMEPFLVVLNALPKSALAPLFIVWIGTGTKTIIVAGISVAIFGSIINLYSGFRETDPDKLLLIQTLGGDRLDMLTKVVIPAAVPNVISVMKVNIGLALVGVIIGEFFAGRRGLGYLIIYGTQVFKLDMVLTSIIILCFLAMLLYKVVQYFEHMYLRGGTLAK